MFIFFGDDTDLKIILKRLDRLEGKVDTIMASITDINDLLSQMNTATNDVAGRIQSLIDQIGTGISSADADTVKAALQAEVDRLHSLAADPANPVPPVA